MVCLSSDLSINNLIWVLIFGRLKGLVDGELKYANDGIDFLGHFNETLSQLGYLCLKILVLFLWNEFLRNKFDHSWIKLLLLARCIQFIWVMHRGRAINSLSFKGRSWFHFLTEPLILLCLLILCLLNKLVLTCILISKLNSMTF